MRIKNLTNIWNISCIYFFAVLFSQLLELFISFSFTKVFVVCMLIIIVWGIMCKHIKANLLSLIIVWIGIGFCAVYYLNLKSIFMYVYPAVLVLLLASLYINNVSSINSHLNYKNINKCILIYCSINFIIYTLKLNDAFQSDGMRLQYRGALPHTNMFSSVISSLFLIIFWKKDKLSILNKCLLTYLIFVSMSRTYILFVIALWLIWIITFTLKKVNFEVKLFIGAGILAAFGTPLFNSLVSFIPLMVRFRTTWFAGNGREYLIKAYYNCIKNSSIIDIINGLSLVKKYLLSISISFSHSFTENSYMGIFLMFGIWGIAVTIIIFWKIMKYVENGQTLLILLLSMVILFVQDILLSVQTGVLFFFSLIAAVTSKEIVREHRKLKFK